VVSIYTLSPSLSPPPPFFQPPSQYPHRYSPVRDGEILFAVQGDNFFREVKYTITFSLMDVSKKANIVENESLLQVHIYIARAKATHFHMYVNVHECICVFMLYMYLCIYIHM